jgi:putative transposase
MPEHVHLIAYSHESGARVEDLLYAIKKPCSSRIKRDLEHSGNPLVEHLTIQERPGKLCFRFWQEGPGFDRNVDEVKAAVTAAEYIHHNPVRRGLCASPDQWRWSSWKFYHEPKLPVDGALPRIDGFPT